MNCILHQVFNKFNGLPEYQISLLLFTINVVECRENKNVVSAILLDGLGG